MTGYQASRHTLDPASLLPDSTRLFTPRCTCGWRWHYVADLTAVADALMAHSYYEGWIDHDKETRR